MPNISQFGTQTDNATVQGTVTDRAMVIPDIPPQGLMSVGPRVTPHFVKPSLWSALTTYHFFDAVHDAAGTSYVAIKPEVPAGTELTNEDYWFLWADPNSQFADLSELVKTFNGRITQNTEDIATNKAAIADTKDAINKVEGQLKAQMGDYAVVFGNSYTMGANVTSGGMFAKISKYFNKSKMFWSSSIGFMPYVINDISVTTSFKDLVAQAQTEMTADERASVTDVFFVMAMGDSRYASIADVITGSSVYVQQVLTTINNTKTVFPKAIIHVMNAEIKALNKSIGYTTAKNVWDVNRSFDKWFKTYNIHWIGMLAFSIWGDPNMVQSDGYHPTEAGYKRLDAGFVNAMHGFIQNGTGEYVLTGFKVGIYNSDATSLEDTSETHYSVNTVAVNFNQNAIPSIPLFSVTKFSTRNVSKIRIFDDMGCIGAFSRSVVTVFDNNTPVYIGIALPDTDTNSSELLLEIPAPITISNNSVKLTFNSCIK